MIFSGHWVLDHLQNSCQGLLCAGDFRWSVGKCKSTCGTRPAFALWLCSGTPKPSSSLCLSLRLDKPLSPSGCSRPVWQAAVLQSVTLTPLLHDKKLWKEWECRSCVLELNPGQKLPQPYMQRTLEGVQSHSAFFSEGAGRSHWIECSLLWGCVHSKQNMGSWASPPASFIQSVRKRIYIA